MNVNVVEDNVVRVVSPLLVISIFEGGTELPGETRSINDALNGIIADLVADGEIRGKLNEVTVIHSSGKIGAKRIAVLGLGKREELTLDRVRQAMGVLAKRAGHMKLTEFATVTHGAGIGDISYSAAAQAIVEGVALGSYDYRSMKTLTDELPAQVTSIVIVERDKTELDGLRQGAKAGEIIARAAIVARDLSNGPANVVTPTYLADQAKSIADRYSLGCEILGPDELRARGFRTLLAVAEGSVQEPRLIVLSYRGEKTAKTLAVVGKGITFDSGGISIKPADGMWQMKHDMSGAAAVIGFFQGLAELRPHLNVIGVIPATENMPGGKATRPGDVIESYTGKTIEILNTDAEGRLVLADALGYVAEQMPDAIIDLATLTGACVVALGTVGTGAFTNSPDLLKHLQEAADFSGERIWQLPIWPEYAEELKSEVADIKNIGPGRYAGAIFGASFLSNFVNHLPWIHLDIAGTAYTEKELSYTPKGASGVGVRLLLEFVKRWA